MKICHVTSVHPAKDGRIFYKECCSLSKAGYDVYEIAPNVSDEICNDVKICGVTVPVNRWKRFLLGKKAVCRKCLEINADVYHFHDPELMPIGYKLKKKYGKKIIFDSHEDVPAQILTKEWVPKFLRSPLSKLYAFYERSLFKYYDLLISVTPTLTSRLKIINSSTFQLTNYPILNTNMQVDIREWGDSICCAGSIAPQRLQHNMIKALEGVEGITLNLAGRYNDKYMQYLKSLPAWYKVYYAGILSFEDVIKFTAKSSVGIIINDYYPNAGYKIGSLGVIKLFEFMQIGLPVICTDFTLWKEIIDKWQCGICVSPHDIEAIRNAIIYLVQNKDMAKRMGDNGRRAVMKEYNWKTQEAILLQAYKNI